LLTGTRERGLLVPLKGGVVELLGLDGSHLKSIRLGSELTTQPVVVQTSRGVLMLAGMKSGLAAFDTATFKPLGRIAIEGADYPTGTLSVADLDGDKIPEVVMTTNSGRVMAVDVAHEKIKWSANVSSEAPAIAFADLNSDTRLDVVLSGRTVLPLVFQELMVLLSGTVAKKREVKLAETGAVESSPRQE